MAGLFSHVIQGGRVPREKTAHKKEAEALEEDGVIPFPVVARNVVV